MRDAPIRDVLPFLRKCCCKLPSFIPNSREQDDEEGKDSDEEFAEEDIDKHDGTTSMRTGSSESEPVKQETP